MSETDLAGRLSYVVIDTDAYALSLRALERSLRVLPVADIVIYSDDPARWGGHGGRVRTIPRLRGLDDYQDISVRRLVEDVATDYCIVLQWDGFALHRDEFSALFRHYDYIGAAWPTFREFNVGNSGFNWRSRRFLEASARVADLREPDEPDDLFLCRRMRVALETRARVRFAPEAVADHFAFEARTMPWNTFGFHGVPHLPGIYGDDLAFLVGQLPARAVTRYASILESRLQRAGADPQVMALWRTRLEAARAAAGPVPGPGAHR